MVGSKNKIVFFWSSGKDSALALYQMQQSDLEVEHLVTMVNAHYDRVTMHGTPKKLLMKQLDSISLPYSHVLLPESPDMVTYEKLVEEKILTLKSQEFSIVAFGDIFLEDLKQYREKEMNRMGMKTVFPLWKMDTHRLIKDFISLGFKAITVSVNDTLGDDFLGQEVDEYFIKNLPPGIDPCGENGEFHTFCFDGPIFKTPIDFKKGEKIKRSYPNPTGEGNVHFWFMDLV